MKEKSLGRVQTIVISLEKKFEDAKYIKLLLKEAKSKRKLRGDFVEAGYHLSASPQTLMGVLNR